MYVAPFVGILIPLILMMKKQGVKNPLKLEYNMWNMIGIAGGSIAGGVGLGYLTLGEATPGLSGGEAQRLKLASELRKSQKNSVFVFDESTIGLHTSDVQTLLNVFQALIDNGATVVVIEHDLDVIKNADYIIDMGPDGGKNGGEIIYSGIEDGLKNCKNSKTAKFL